MLELDVITLIHVNFFISLLIAGGLGFMLFERYICPGMYYWVCGMSLMCIGLFFSTYRVSGWIMISEFIASAVKLGGLSCIWLGMEEYCGRLSKKHYLIFLVSLCIGAALWWASIHQVEERLRAGIYSLALTCLYFLIIRSAMYERKTYEFGRLLLVVVLTVSTCTVLFRIITLNDVEEFTMIDSNLSNIVLMFTATFALIGMGHSVQLIAAQWLQQQLAVFAAFDALTGIYNRYGLREHAENLFQETILMPKTVRTVVMIDIDHFKNINDQYGHFIGDLVLKELSSRISRNIRHQDVFARYGGEEFVVVLPETNQTAALVWAERIRRTIAEESFKMNQFVINLTVSIGLAEISATSELSLDDAIKKADIALYDAKQSGRNRICCFLFSYRDRV